MMDQEKSSVWIDASIATVWRAVTEEQLLMQWYALDSTWEIPKLEAGAEVIFTLLPNDHNQLVEKLPMVLTIKNVTPNREFSFYLGIEETLIAIVLEEEQNGTVVTFNSSGYEASLANLKALVESDIL
ncbi:MULTISPECIES: SRPBCC domain-containing protein [unclassified Lysinibacillus]|uniref:SRPBCC family protein n=1 Tax=unclassified Lysinibacillus TaxID=2636778 RepID=UPI002011CD58|nr:MULTISPECIES: SRPBCC domain-containing protein [unclassified Lysinibacillus]MCL1694663.1 SRPBCC domain-containing protein [Lysinibacillus sp. BPa_S21]MCL1699524.1 SRPBCC domain-containing protein [Lysinibacillus sp. Bpr_S20]